MSTQGKTAPQEGENQKTMKESQSKMPFMSFLFLKCSSPCLSLHILGLKRKRDDEDYTPGGAPLDVALKKNIVHLYYDNLLTPEEIGEGIQTFTNGDTHGTNHKRLSIYCILYFFCFCS